MSTIYTIYVPSTAGFIWAAKNIATQYGWLRATQTKEPWMVFDLNRKKVSFTYQPPNTNDSSVLVANSIQDITSNMPPFDTAATPVFTPPVATDSDPYAFNITLIY